MQQLQASQFVASDGINLSFMEAGPANGEPVLLLHGFPEFWWGWRHQSDALAEAGFQVVIPDMRGYGQSDAPSETSAYQLDRLVKDVMELASERGWHSFNIVGHDWGGIVAWAVAAAHPMLVKRLVILNAPHLDAVQGVMRNAPSQLVRSFYVALFQIPRLPEFALSRANYLLLRRALLKTSRKGTFSHEDLDNYVAEWRRPGRLTAMLNYYRALVTGPRAPLGRIVPPVLVLWGCRDQALDFRLAQESLLQCANGRMLVHRRATHWIHLEEPAWVSDNLRRFLCEDHELDRPEPGTFQETL